MGRMTKHSKASATICEVSSAKYDLEGKNRTVPQTNKSTELKQE